MIHDFTKELVVVTLLVQGSVPQGTDMRKPTARQLVPIRQTPGTAVPPSLELPVLEQYTRAAVEHLAGGHEPDFSQILPSFFYNVRGRAGG